MVNYRRPVSQRRSIKSRKATTAKRTFTPPRRNAYKPINSLIGTNPQSMLVHRGIGLPDKFRTKLIFIDSIVLGPFTPITASKAYNLSSPYDPDPAIGGGQPAYFDQLAALYNRVNVVGAKMSCTFAMPNNSGVSGDGPYHIGVTAQPTTTSLTTTDSAFLAAQANTSSALLPDGQTKSCVATYKPAFLNATQVNDSATSGTATPYYGIVWASPQGTAATGTVNVIVTVEYICDFFNLKAVVDL